MIDKLFGSKTRAKLLHLFLSNPGKAFYVREITRLIDEQINSVRRELSNMLAIGIIKSDNMNNKLYYEVNQRYEYYEPLKTIFTDESMESAGADYEWWSELKNVPGLRVAIAAGSLVDGSSSSIDLLLVGNVPKAHLSKLMKQIEKQKERSLNYSIIGYDEFRYRLNVRDRFIMEVLNGKYDILMDVDGVLESRESREDK